MNFTVKTSLGILWMIVLVFADGKFDKQCQALQCKPLTEICRLNPKCQTSKKDELSKCVYCASKADWILPETPLPLAPRLLSKSGELKLLADNRDLRSNATLNESSYDEYYDYDEEETSDKNELDEEGDYLDDYADPFNAPIDSSQPIRKLGTCPKVVQATGKCDTAKTIQPDCRFDTDCPGDFKCCEVACGRRVCNSPMKPTVSVCPTSFQCSLNCRLGYQTDSNGCLKCECQSCPSMEQCKKNCPFGYLKDLFGCDICECNEQCPPFSCSIHCPPGVGYVQSENGCPLCQCTTVMSKPIESTSSCQEDIHCPSGFRCLNDASNVPMCQAVTCPQIKCRANCGDAGFEVDADGCQICKCKVKENVQCSRAMCRMFCEHGFKRDENGCEYCACNESPQPCPKLNCQKTCPNGFRKDYSGCQTCDCNDQPERVEQTCLPVTCDLKCKYDYQRDQSGCQVCACNQCPARTCRMFCVYGFRKNQDGCEICECDWSPIAEKIACSERIPCEGTRTCNLNLKFCETVNPDRVNWFLYDFGVRTDMFNDHNFVQTFKNGFIHNVATKYMLEIPQIVVSSVQENGLTSFQIMPFFNDNLELFEQKMDQIDVDLNSHEFRAVLPAVARAIEEGTTSGGLTDRLKTLTRFSRKSLIFMSVLLLSLTAVFVFIAYVNICRRRRVKYPTRSESKTPIYDTSYHQTPTDDDHYHAVHAPDGTAYVVVESDDAQLSNDKRVLV